MKSLLFNKTDKRVYEGFAKDQESLIRGRVAIILIIGATFVPFFAAVDYILYPGHFLRFIGYRLAASLVCLVLYFINAKWYFGYRSFLLGVVGFYVVGLTIITMVVQTNGYETRYYAGLNLVFLTFCTVLTVDARRLALHSTILYCTYVASVLWFSKDGRIELFLANNMFVISTVLIILVASFVNHNLRLKEYRSRKELETAQEELVQKERFAALGKLIAVVSHEIRNPLGTVRTSLFSVDERVRGRGLGVERALDRAERNIVRCDRIIEELLGYSRDKELNLERTDLDTWLSEILDDQTLPEEVILERRLFSGSVLEIDRERLRRSVLNIIDNASQAIAESDKGRGLEGDERPKGTVRVETRVTDRGAEILIIDTGTGIPLEELGKIFQPLYSTRGFGVGFGLPIVKQIMERHGGGVVIQSKHGKGTRVTLWLPILEAGGAMKNRP